MLSSILSRIFGAAFILIVLGSIGNLIAQITLHETGKGSWISFGKPGIVVKAERTIERERNAPDSTINYQIIKKNGGAESGGVTLTKSNIFFDGKKQLRDLIEDAQTKGEKITLDTEINLIGTFHGSHWDNSSNIQSIDSSSDGKFILHQYELNNSYESDNKRRQIYNETRDTFITRLEAERHRSINAYTSENIIIEENNTEETLRVLPANKLQHFLFIIFQAINIFSFAMIFLMLSNLFNNFFKRHYFIYENIIFLRRTGWYLLMPQITATILYFCLLFHLYPVKLLFSYPKSNDASIVAHYNFKLDVDWLLLFIGLSIIVLSYIFKDGLKMKEENELTV